MKKNTQKVKLVILVFTVLFLSINNGYSQWTQVGLDIDGESAVDRSGRSVSISADGSIVAIGASGNDGNGVDSGHVRVYQNMSGTWFQLGQDIDGSGMEIFFGDRVSISSNGLRLAVHSVRNTSANINSGETKIYDFIGGSWTQVGTGIIGAGEFDGFNGIIDMSSDGMHIAIGSISNDSFAGIVRVFSYNGSDWVQTGADFVGSASSQLGKGLSLSANGLRLSIADLGSVKIFEYNGSTWVELGSGIAGVIDDGFSGVSLSSDGNRLATGSPGNDTNGFLSGNVRVFQFNGSDWVQMGANINGEATGDQIGKHHTMSLSSNGLTVAIGSTSNNIRFGHVRVFSFNGIDWVQQGVDIDGEAVQDDSGGSVSISANGSIVAIGATENDGSANLAGHTRIFEFPQSIWSGAPQTFSLSDNSDWTQEVNQDRITDNVWLTRADTGEIFNIAAETIYNSTISPVDTEWAFGTVADIESLTFNTLENIVEGVPANVIDQDLVLHLISENIFIDLKFTELTLNTGTNRLANGGGGYSYVRSTNQNLSIKDFELNNTFLIYPNPTNNFFKIDTNTIISGIEIYDVSGKQVLNYKSQSIYDITPLHSGLYFVNIKYADGFAVKKLIVE